MPTFTPDNEFFEKVLDLLLTDEEPYVDPSLCEIEFEDNGPHPGCREFADTVYSPCGGEQRFLFETDGPYGGESLRVCCWHAELYGDDPRVTLVPLV